LTNKKIYVIVVLYNPVPSLNRWPWVSFIPLLTNGPKHAMLVSEVNEMMNRKFAKMLGKSEYAEWLKGYNDVTIYQAGENTRKDVKYLIKHYTYCAKRALKDGSYANSSYTYYSGVLSAFKHFLKSGKQLKSS
jgi:hypothetical protein